jgi:hypothetical protein
LTAARVADKEWPHVSRWKKNKRVAFTARNMIRTPDLTTEGSRNRPAELNVDLVRPRERHNLTK